jgi:S-adenosylmethionine decarboxylase
MQGLHLTADLSGCRAGSQLMTDADSLVATLVAAVEAAGLRSLSQLAYQFPPSAHGPGGVTATVLLAESHACIHTWPEQAGVTLDVYVCNFGGDHSVAAHSLMDALVALFSPRAIQRHSLQRGLP